MIDAAARRAVLVALATWIAGCATTSARASFQATYRIRCTPDDARVVIDEVDQGACRLRALQSLGLSAGPHRLTIVRDGYFPVEEDLPDARGRYERAYDLRPIPE